MTRIEDLIEDGWRGEPASVGSRPIGPDRLSVRPWKDCISPEFVQSWRRLAASAATPNPFGEHWFVLPSLEQFDPRGTVHLATLVVDGELAGLMPLYRARDYHGHPLPHIGNWMHPNSFCGEPLIAGDHAKTFWSAVLDWSDRNWRSSLFLHIACLPTDGIAVDTLNRVCKAKRRANRAVHRVSRACLRHGLSPEAHLVSILGKKRRKELSRKRRRLEETGQTIFTRATGEDGLDEWIDQFLQLEDAGWKGQESSSLVSARQTACLFRESLHGAAREQRLERLAFHVDGKPVAMLCNFVTPPLAHSFKTAFDEDLYKLSPGMLLQVENLALLEREEIGMTDSCAAAGHPMIEQIWDDRREIVSVSIPVGGTIRRGVGDILTSIEARRSENNR